jgi:hypothetical protein
MKGFDHPPYMQLYLIANAAALLLLLACRPRPSWARWGFIGLFGCASWLNATTAWYDPGVYLQYADLTFLPVYRKVILGPFSAHITGYVVAIAVAQALIALGLLLGGRLARIATWGAVVFLVAIAPFGVGSGFPCTLLFAAGLLMLLWKGLDRPAWERASR